MKVRDVPFALLVLLPTVATQRGSREDASRSPCDQGCCRQLLQTGRRRWEATNQPSRGQHFAVRSLVVVVVAQSSRFMGYGLQMRSRDGCWSE